MDVKEKKYLIAEISEDDDSVLFKINGSIFSMALAIGEALQRDNKLKLLFYSIAASSLSFEGDVTGAFLMFKKIDQLDAELSLNKTEKT